MRLPPGRALDARAGLEFLWAHCSHRRATCVSSSTGISAGRVRRRPTRSVSGSGCRLARTPRRRKGADFDLSQFHADALNLGSLGLDPLRAALARI